MPPLLTNLLETLTTLVLAAIVIALWRRARKRLQTKNIIPPTMSLVAGSLVNWAVIIVAAVMIMESFGLHVRTVWTGILSVLVLVAVAFFASWSVLSNILSSLLLLTFSRLRVGDIVELRDTKRDEFGISGRVMDLNAFFVTLQELEDSTRPEHHPAQIQIPNHLFFFRVMRRWPGDSTQPLIRAYTEHSKIEEPAAPPPHNPTGPAPDKESKTSG